MIIQLKNHLFVITIAITHHLIGVNVVEHNGEVLGEMMFLQMSYLALVHLKGHQLVLFWQIQETGLADIEIALQVSVSIWAQQVSSSTAEIANEIC